MIPLKRFLVCVQENAIRIHAYELGHDGSDGKCDCIGMIIGALALAGFRWPGVHGSNWAARNAMATFGYIEGESQCYPGMIVYKAREPGEDRYDLPGSYKNSPDQRDYYHVGVVTSTAPLVITHCTSVEGGIKQDSTLGKWRWGGKIKYVDYSGNEAEEKPMEPYKAKVCAENGYPVKMRSQPSIKSAVITSLPVNTVVGVYDVLDDWCGIRYGAQSGYMMSKFLEPEDSAVDADKWNEVREMLENAKDLLTKATELFEELIQKKE